MMNTSRAVVKDIICRDQSMTKLYAVFERQEILCINYDLLTGEVSQGDEILVNTTAVDLKLGSGGFHFVIANLSAGNHTTASHGHIMKLRYTPFQMNCLCAEAQESPFHEVFKQFESLSGMKVIVGTLHSMLAPVVLCVHGLFPHAKIVYIMTDGGALPIWLSDTVRRLKAEKLLHRTITYGNAFGGDLECINIYTALIAAKEIAQADIAVVTMGPGIAGTATPYGFSGAEQGHIIDAVNQLEGLAVAIPRLSFADQRERHKGISHHSLTVLSKLCSTKAMLAVPVLPTEQDEIIRKQLVQYDLTSKHHIVYKDTRAVDDILQERTAYMDKMGKGYEADPAYFLTCGLSALLYN